MEQAVEIVRFTDADIPFGKMLTDAENWHRTNEDWRRMLAISPSGMFKARLGGKDVGIAGLLAYEKVAWMHSVIVVDKMRGRGIGRVLMRTCIDHAKDQGILSVKLDSVRGFEGFYGKFGFVEEFESRRFLRNGAHFHRMAERVDRKRLDELLEMDEAANGYDRSRVLTAIYDDAPELAFCISGPKGIRGFVLARRGEQRTQIGPCIVLDKDPIVATHLISTLIGSNPEAKYRLCISGTNEGAVKLALDLGFESVMSSTRMYLGQKFHESDASFAMISPEKG